MFVAVMRQTAAALDPYALHVSIKAPIVQVTQPSHSYSQQFVHHNLQQLPRHPLFKTSASTPPESPPPAHKDPTPPLPPTHPSPTTQEPRTCSQQVSHQHFQKFPRHPPFEESASLSQHTTKVPAPCAQRTPPLPCPHPTLPRKSTQQSRTCSQQFLHQHLQQLPRHPLFKNQHCSASSASTPPPSPPPAHKRPHPSPAPHPTLPRKSTS
jgi:hypothetical protein